MDIVVFSAARQTPLPREAERFARIDNRVMGRNSFFT
jgi:hypothetical protein